MNLILRIWLSRGKTKEDKYRLLNDYANFTSTYFRPLYMNYCRNLTEISKYIRESK